MHKTLFCLLFIVPTVAFGQIGFGIKAGPNFANITNADNINSSSRTGFHAGVFLDGSTTKVLSSRTEILFSRQGYEFSTQTNTGTVDLDYILLPQFMAINITKYVQLQLGGQVAYLISAKVDSTNQTGDPDVDKLLGLYNRFDYGLGGGIEVHPVKFLVVGARMNISLGKVYKEPEPGQEYSFIPDIDAKNNLFQVFAGVRFGKEE